MSVIDEINNEFHLEYSEVTLYLTSLIVLLLALTNTAFDWEVLGFFFMDIRGIVIFLLMFIGVVSSVYFAFSNKRIPRHLKNCMLIFVVFINFVIAYAGFKYKLVNTLDLFIFFPALNVMYALYIILLWRNGKINSDNISDKNAKLHEIIVGTIVVFCLFLYHQYIVHSYWAISASMCLSYAVFINESVMKYIFPSQRNP